MLEADFSDVLRAAAEIGAKGATVVNVLEPVMERSALNLKKGMAAEFAGSRHFRRVAGAVSYDRIGYFTKTLGYEVGPEVGRGAGSLGGIAVEGGANGGGGTVDVDQVLAREAPLIEANIMAALGLL